MNHLPGPCELATATATEALVNLKRKVAARKVQALREKIAKDIHAIAPWRTNEPSIPEPEEQQEAYFNKLECNGIWKQVLSNLTHFSDITNAWLACVLFREHLEQKRFSLELHQVFGVLRKHQNLYPDAQRHESALSKRDVLNLRLVSKTWKEAAEDQFLSPEGFSEPDWHLRKDPWYNVMVNYSLFPAVFYKPSDVKRALSVLRTSTSCGALLKIVDVGIFEYLYKLRLRSAAEVAEYYTLLGELFAAHGEHVWSLHFGGNFHYEHLRNLVSRMPNLKELYINCTICSTTPLRLSEDEEGRMLARLPFSTIPSLTRLTFEQIPVHRSRCSAEIIRRNPSLKTVSISEEATEPLREFLPVLENLRLECFDFGLNENGSIHLRDIQPLGLMQWPLRVLIVLNLARANGDSTLDMDEAEVVNAYDFLGILNHFSETLEQVNVDSMIFKDDGRSRTAIIDFPNLTNIVFYPGLLNWITIMKL